MTTEQAAAVYAKPQFTHDCDRDVYLGRYECRLYGACDLYYADHGGMTDTVIARFGNDGPDYVSGLPLVRAVPCLTEAYKRAVAQGIEVKGKL